MQTETYCGIRPLTEKEIQDLIQCEANDMDAETTVKFINDLIDAGSEETRECTHIEKNSMDCPSCVFKRIFKGCCDIQ